MAEFVRDVATRMAKGVVERNRRILDVRADSEGDTRSPASRPHGAP